MGTTFTE